MTGLSKFYTFKMVPLLVLHKALGFFFFSCQALLGKGKEATLL
jgi:hypothetical protein